MKPLAIRHQGKELSLMPACCIHWPIGERDLLEEWVDAVRTTPNARTILLGDSLDLARGHYRNHIRSYRDDENSQEALDGYAWEEVRKLAKVLKPIRDKVWGVIRGNHFWEFSDGTNSEQYLCQLLELPYLGVMGMIRVAFTWNGHKTHTINIYAHHSGGSCGARTTGGDVAAAQRTELGYDFDIHLVGHTHRRFAWKEPNLTLTAKGEPRVIERTKVIARCGSFLKGLRDDCPSATRQHLPSYAEVKALRPTDLGWVRIDVLWRQRREGDQNRAHLTFPQYTLVY